MYNLFDYLDTDDRKKAKLVSEEWCETLTARKFRKKEKIMFRFNGKDDFKNDITNITQWCNVIYSLEFQNISLENVPTDFWRLKGPQIEEINLYESHIELVDFIRCISVYCPKLTSLYFETEKSFDCHNSFNKLASEGVQLANIRQLKTGIFLNVETVPVVLTLFPNLTKIKSYITRNLSQKVNYYDELFVNRINIFGNQITECSFDLQPPIHCLNYNWKMPNLEKLKLRLFQCMDDACKFIDNQFNLKYLEIEITSTEESVKSWGLTMLNIALKRCKKLESFQLTYAKGINRDNLLRDEDYSIFKTLIESRLKKFIFPICYSGKPDDEASRLPNIINDSIQILRLRPSELSVLDIEYCKLYTHFSGLKSLSITDSEACMGILKEVSKNSPKLEQLHIFPRGLVHDMRESNVYFNLCDISFFEIFPYLKSLCLTVISNKEIYLEEAIKLYCLEHLAIRISCDPNRGSKFVDPFLGWLPLVSPKLKSMCLTVGFSLRNDVWCKFIHESSNLKYFNLLRIEGHSKNIINRVMIRNAFNLHKSLKVLIVTERLSSDDDNLSDSSNRLCPSPFFPQGIHCLKDYIFTYNRVTEVLQESINKIKAYNFDSLYDYNPSNVEFVTL